MKSYLSLTLWLTILVVLYATLIYICQPAHELEAFTEENTGETTENTGETTENTGENTGGTEATNPTETSTLYDEQLCNTRNNSCVTYTDDYKKLTLKLFGGYIRLRNASKTRTEDDLGRITIAFGSSDYREEPFDVNENTNACFKKWRFFKYNGETYSKRRKQKCSTGDKKF